MLKFSVHLAAYVFALLALCGLGYLVLSLWSEWRFLAQQARGTAAARERIYARGQHSETAAGHGPADV